MNDLTVFQNPDFGQVRTITRDGEPWFVAADVCRALEIKNNRDALAKLDSDEKGVALTDTLGGAQKMTIVNEPGLYSLVLGSRKPEAKAFKRWITHEVIPAIRKTGQYSTKPTITIDPDALALIVSTAVSETAKQLVPIMKEMVEQAVSMKAPVLIEPPKKRTRNPVLLKDFADVLNQVMKEQRVNGNEVADRMNVGKATVSNWKNRRNQPNRMNYMRFVMEFNVPLSELGEGIF